MVTEQLELYHYWRSSCSWRVRWALDVKKISYVSHHINLLEQEHKKDFYLKKNPLGLVPTLKINQGYYLNESLAIIEWLEEKYPVSSLLPKDPNSRALSRRLAYIITSSIQPLQNLQTMRHLSPEQHIQKEWSCHWLKLGFKAYESLINNTFGTYSLGGSLTIADLCLIPQVYNAYRFNLNMNAFPLISKIYDNCLQTISCDNSHPDRYKP